MLSTPCSWGPIHSLNYEQKFEKPREIKILQIWHILFETISIDRIRQNRSQI
jgi:hypothetical protein